MKIIFVFVEKHLAIQEVKISCKVFSGLNINTMGWPRPQRLRRLGGRGKSVKFSQPCALASRLGTDRMIFAEKKRPKLCN